MRKKKFIYNPFFIIFTAFMLFFCCSCGRAEKEPDIMGTVDWGGLCSDNCLCEAAGNKVYAGD